MKNKPECEICNATFTKTSSLKSHIEAVHEGKKRYQCHLCEFATARNFALTSHFAKYHPDYYEKIRKFESKDCETEKEAKEKRSQLLDTDAKSVFKCELCDQTFKRKRSIKKHIQAIHDQIKPYQCHICGYANARRMSMTLHFAKYHEKDTDGKIKSFTLVQFLHCIDMFS